MTLVIQYLRIRTQLEDPMETKRLTKEASNYIIIDEQLYRRGLSQLLLKCMRPDQISFVHEEVYERSCDHHLGGKALALKVL